MGLFGRRKSETTGAACCFCDQPIADDAIYLTAEWGGEGDMWQLWAAHRMCLAAQLSDGTRQTGGPFFEG